MIAIDRNDSTPFYQQIHRQMVRSIESGLYRVGDRLPSIRPFAQQLGVSRNTVEQAYLELVQEGYVSSRQGSGYYVSLAVAPRHVEQSLSIEYRQALAELQAYDRAQTKTKPHFDFAVEGMEPDAFPFYRWARISRDVMLDEGRAGICEVIDPRGLRAFREQIARHLAKDQDINAQPEQIAVFPSVGHAMVSILRLLAENGFSALVEDPCHPQVSTAIRESGIPAVSSLLNRTELRGGAVRFTHGHPHIVCVSPENRYPMNTAMSLDDRKRLVAWASQTDSLLLENTYCHEFRFGGAHVPTLHALSTDGRVIVVGSFAESLSPSMGIAYLVLPPSLMIRWLKQRGQSGQLPWHVQATFAEFMRQDLWTAHLRRLQTSLRNKRHAMAIALETHMGDASSFIQQESSLHMLIRVKDGRPESELVELAARKGVRVYPTADTWTNTAPADWNYVMIGYAGIPFDDIEPGIAALAHAWFG